MNERESRPSQTEGQTPTVTLSKGHLVQCRGGVWMVEKVIDFMSVVATDLAEGRTRVLPIRELEPPPDQASDAPQRRPLEHITDTEWETAEERYKAIKPLLELRGRTRADVEERGTEVRRNTGTLYEWLRRYTDDDDLTALIPRKRGWPKGKTRIDDPVEEIISTVIKGFYLKKDRPTIDETVVKVQSQFPEKDRPSTSTIRARIRQVPERERLRLRGAPEKARAKFHPAPGEFPNADYPLAYMQVDHTPVDIILVDDVHRKPIGRPFLTVAIDIFSRMIPGFHLSLDPPSRTSIALCVAQAVLPKDELLVKRGIDAEWPVWGFPKTIHVDNGGDFRSKTFQRACGRNGADIEYRPIRRPEYGGHVERVIGTLMTAVHSLPGTTYSSVHEKGEHDPEKDASMTFAELETWLLTFVCKVYHERVHSELDMSPLSQWKLGVFGTDDTPGAGLPPKPSQTVLLDFLPQFERTVQRRGVAIDGLRYYAESLRPWIRAPDPDDEQRTLKLVFRRDPRDISRIWFHDPNLGRYFEVPTAGRTLPPTSLWEYLEARKRRRAYGAKHSNPERLLEARNELREQVSAAEKTSKKARRKAQRRRQHEKKPAETALKTGRSASDAPTPAPDPETDWSDEQPRSFGIAE